MSDRLHQVGSEQGGKPKQADPAARKAQRSSKPGKRSLPATLDKAGNSALATAMESGGKKLPAALQARMEGAFGTSFQDVRVHDDAPAQSAAAALDAQAFARGDTIVLGAEAPDINSAEAEPLMAHELAHVVQQRQASEVLETKISGQGDSFELQADHAAQRALAGQHVGMNVSGAPAAVQRQSRPSGQQQAAPAVTRQEVEQVLLAFLQRLASVRPAPNLRDSGVVRNALRTLASGPNNMFFDVNDFLSRVPNDAAQIAHQFAQRLPALPDRAALDRLRRLASVDSPSGTAVSRAIDLASSSAAGGSENQADPQRENPADRVEREASIFNRATGRPDPTSYGPYSGDVLQIDRYLRGLGQAVHPQTPRAPAVTGRNYPEVEAAIQRIPVNALVPEEARGTPQAASFADAREFARSVARQIDEAQQRGQDTVTINLGDNYAQITNRPALRAAVEQIIAQIRDALPHHGSAVTNVDISTGRTWLTRGRARRSE